MASIYKYLGLSIKDVFSECGNSFTIKISTLKEYNDPYEQFLTIDFSQDPSDIAQYKEAIRNEVDCFVSCFSKSPDIPPMWAHYANNMTGIVLEIDEGYLHDAISSDNNESLIQFSDIEYRETPNPDLQRAIMLAQTTCDRRNYFRQQSAIRYAMYFYKTSSWQYENERRLLLDPNIKYTPKKIGQGNTINLLELTSECITSIIYSDESNLTLEDRALLELLKNKNRIQIYQAKVDKAVMRPYFVDDSLEAYQFIDNKFQVIRSCCKCNAPHNNRDDMCPDCAISEEDEIKAYFANPNNIYKKYI